MRFTKRLSLNSHTVLKAKLYNFGRRSIWKYAIASGLIAFADPELFGSFSLTFIGILSALIVLSLVLIKFSANIMGKRRGFESIAEFSYDGINFNYVNSDKKDEMKSWDWINKIVESKNEIWMETNERPRFLLNMPKSKLSNEEIDFFRNVKVASR